MIAFLAALAGAFRSVTVSREPDSGFVVKVVVNGPALAREVEKAFLALTQAEVGAEPDLPAFQAWAEAMTRLAAALNWQQPWPPQAPVLTVVGTTFVPGSTPRLDIEFSAPLNSATVDASAFAFEAPIQAGLVAVDLGSAVAQVSLIDSGLANPGPKSVTITGVQGTGGERLNPDPQQAGWVLP